MGLKENAKNKIRVLSLFDGISVAQQALTELGYEIEYYASEIDKYAVSVTQYNFPNTKQVGDVKLLKGEDFKDIDLIIGGSPCQDLSIAKRGREGLKGARSGLFYEFARLVKEVKPKYFVLENVNSMPKDAKEEITKVMGVEPIMINASLVSAQNRKRLFWTNIPNVTQPEDRGILLEDILESGDSEKLKSYCIDASYYKGTNWKHYQEKGTKQLVKDDKFTWITNPRKNTLLTNRPNDIEQPKAKPLLVGGTNATIRLGNFNSGGQGDRVYSPEGKSTALSANGGGRGAKTGLYAVALRNRGEGKRPEIGGDKANSMTTVQTDSMILENSQIRKLTPIECERLQSLPEREKSCIIRVCSDRQNNYVNVVGKNLKLLPSAGNVENTDLKRNAQFVVNNLNINNQQASKPVPYDVLISCEENTFQILYQKKLLASVSGVEWKQNAHHLKSIDDFVHLIVGINTILERIITAGGVESLQKNNRSIVVENGNSVVNICGRNIKQLAKDAQKDLITPNKLLKFTISNPFGQENSEQTIQTLFSYVVLVISGYIPKEMWNQSTLTFQLKSKVGYTKEPNISNTQRYKMLGNAFNKEVVKHILKFAKNT